jgi:glutathione S-transferase
MRLYDLQASGNCYKIRLFAGLARLDIEQVAVDLAAGAHRQPALLALNPLGQLPILEDGELVIRDSQAILVYLAGQYAGLAWWPAHAAGQAQIMQWLSFAANEVQHGLCAARLVERFEVALDLPQALAKAAAALALLDAHLAQHQWLALGRPTIAECAVYPYVALAPEGGVDLQPYPQVRAWLERVAGLPGYVAAPVQSPT